MLSRLNAGNGDAALATVVAARAADVAYGIAGVGRTATAAGSVVPMKVVSVCATATAAAFEVVGAIEVVSAMASTSSAARTASVSA